MSHNPLDAARDEGFIAGVTSIQSETLRDRFAMAALTGLLACRPPHSTVTRKERAEYAYKYADAMMEARK